MLDHRLAKARPIAPTGSPHARTGKRFSAGSAAVATAALAVCALLVFARLIRLGLARNPVLFLRPAAQVREPTSLGAKGTESVSWRKLNFTLAHRTTHHSNLKVILPPLDRLDPHLAAPMLWVLTTAVRCRLKGRRGLSIRPSERRNRHRVEQLCPGSTCLSSRDRRCAIWRIVSSPRDDTDLAASNRVLHRGANDAHGTPVLEFPHIWQKRRSAWRESATSPA
jgi:hypothetical protein